MPYKQKIGDVWALRRRWNRHDVSDVQLSDIAGTLTEKMLSSNEISDLSAHNALFDPDWRVPLPPQYNSMLEEICERIGINASSIKELGLEWSAAVNPVCERGNGPNPKFVKTCQDSLSDTYEVRSAIIEAKETLYKTNLVCKFGYSSFAWMVASTIPVGMHAIATRNLPLTIELPILMLNVCALRIFRLGMDLSRQCKMLYVAPFARMEEAAIPRLAKQWLDTAKEIGNLQISIESKFESLNNRRVDERLQADPDVRLHDLLAKREEMRAKLEKFGWLYSKIEDVEPVRLRQITYLDSNGVPESPDDIINAVVEKITKPTEEGAPYDMRGLVIRLSHRIQPNDSPLAGTELILAALPPGKKDLNNSNSSNPSGPNKGEVNRPRRRGLGKIGGWIKKGGRGGWAPEPAT